MIKVVDLFKSFGTEKTFITNVLKGINLTIETGEFATIVGPSGSGKSTFLNVLSTLQRPSSGKIMFDDVDTAALNEEGLANFRNKYIGFIFQNHHLFPELTALENTLMPAEIARMGPQYLDQAKYLLDRVGLTERLDYKPVQLSGGQCQRVAIARALLLSPKVIFADEPTGNLDQHSTSEIFSLLSELNTESKTTIVMVTHDKGLADRAERIISIVDGQII
ncbi:MAG: ABC transporter ATP-binding protein [Vampirovibrionia bacterium]